MIEYDYVLKRDMGGAGVVTLAPKTIPKVLPNVLRIEGPNGIGKSTLLNIIALGLWGTDSRKIHASLLQKMGTLKYSDYQGLKFNFKLSNDKDFSLKVLKKDLNSQEIIVEESIDGGLNYFPVSKERFEENYNLIYDIASNPIERLYDLLKDLREEERLIGSKFKEFANYLYDVLNEIESSRNVERLETVKDNITNILHDNKEIDSTLPTIETSLNILEKHAYLQLYYNCLNEYETLLKHKQELEQSSQDVESDSKKVGKKLLKCSREIEELRKRISQNYQTATSLIKVTIPDEQKVDPKIWKNNLNPSSTDENDLNLIHDHAIHLQNIYSLEIEKIKSQNSFQDAAVVERLIQALKEFENSPLMIPKLKVSIADLINILKEDNAKNYLILSRYRNIQSLSDILTDISEDTTMLLFKLDETKGVSDDRRKNTQALAEIIGRKNELKTIQDNLNKLQKKVEFYFNKCIGKGFDELKLRNSSYKVLSADLPSNKEFEYFLGLTEDQINHRITELNNEVTKKRKKKEDNLAILGIFDNELKELEKQKPHELETSKNEISKLYDKADAISQKLLTRYDQNIKNLIEKNVNKKLIEKDPDKKKHFDEISHYLAHRIGEFPHMERKYKAAEVDLISGIIQTEDNAIIHVNDIGTGHSQSTYLCSLLNVANDGRKIIALFDEIAMMDDKSLEPLCIRLKTLYDSNRLLVGILVQKSEKFQIKALV